MSGDKKIISRRDFLRLAGFTTVGLAAACTQATPTEPPAAVVTEEAAPEITGTPIEIGVMWEEGPWMDIVKEIGDALVAEYPGTKITWTFANSAAQPATALRWQGGDPLDVDTNKFTYWAQDTWGFVDNDLLLDLTPYLEETLPSGEKWIDTFYPLVMQFSKDQREGPNKGKYFSVPENTTLMVIHYNKKAFDEMGVQPAKTWTEFLALCETIKEKGAANGMKPICVSGPTAPYVCHWWDRLTQRVCGSQAVLDFFYKETHLRDDPNFLKAAQEMEKLYANGYLMDGYEGADFTGAQALFFQGKAAMIHMGTWLVGEMADVVPADFEVGVFDFPAVEGGAGDQLAMFGGAFPWSIANPAKATSHEVNVPLAVEYLKRFTSKDANTKRAELTGAISAVKGAPSPEKLPGVDKLVEAAASAEFIYYYWGIATNTALTDVWWNATQALWLGKVDAAGMIAMLDEGIDKYRTLKAAGTQTP